ncbi:hypothetical protein KQX54_004501 [Cotesia glomerata]|uniref:Uncharacterized protein n=1 Tax=Cotesia glomerata TaxID=32391 RepID=A0AAV7HY91_COTGL|nr:hypothetical protein KQX54_004501 [Cotesia glomerata]
MALKKDWVVKGRAFTQIEKSLLIVLLLIRVEFTKLTSDVRARAGYAARAIDFKISGICKAGIYIPRVLSVALNVSPTLPTDNTPLAPRYLSWIS